MSQARLGQGPRRGSDVVVLVSASHTRICGPAAAEHELRNAGAAAIAAPPSSRRRLSYDMGQLPEDAVIAEEGHGPNFECDIDFSVDEQGVTPVVRLVHHGPSSYLEMIDREAHASRHAVSPQQPMLMSRSPSPQSRSASPFTRPPTPIARPLSPKFRVMSPQQAARLSSFRATTSSIIRNPMSPRFAQQAQICRYASQKQSRSGSWHHGRALPSSRPQSGTTLVKIMEDCRLCAKKRKAMDELRAHHPGGPNDLQRRGEATDVARSATSGSSRSPSAAAAIVAAAASAAGIHLEAYGSELEPCLDCLEEFVRRERVKKGVASDTSVERKKGEASVASAERPEKVDKKAEKHHHPPSPPPASNMKEVLKTTLSSDGSTTEIAVSTSTAVTEGTSAASTAHTSRPGHSSPHGHHTSPHGHHTSPPGHHTSPHGHNTSPPGHHTSPPGHHTSTPGHNTSTNSHTSPPGHHATPPGHHTSPPGHHTSPPGHNTAPPSHNTSAPGHHTSPHGHHSSQHGHTSPHGHASQLGCTASSDSQSTVSTSAQSPAPYRCPVCHACKCCGTVPPNSRM